MLEDVGQVYPVLALMHELGVLGKFVAGVRPADSAWCSTSIITVTLRTSTP